MGIDCPIKCAWFDIWCRRRTTESTLLLYLRWMVFSSIRFLKSWHCLGAFSTVIPVCYAFSTPRIACLLCILQSKVLTLNIRPECCINHRCINHLDFMAEHFSSSEPRKNWQRFMGNCFPLCTAMRLPLFRKLYGIIPAVRESDLDAYFSTKVRFCD